MHQLRFREGQRFSNEARQPLAQGIIPAFDVRGLPRIFATRRMLLSRDDLLVSFPEIAVAVSAAIGHGNPLPKLAAGVRAAVTNKVSDDLPCRTAQRNPNPAFIGFFQNK